MKNSSLNEKSSDSRATGTMLLDDNNWSVWKFRMLAYVRAKGLMSILTGTMNEDSFRKEKSFYEKFSSNSKKENPKKIQLIEKSNDDSQAQDYFDIKEKEEHFEGFTLSTFQDADSLLFYKIISAIKETILHEFINLDQPSSYLLWVKLQKRFESQSTASVRQLLNQLLNIKQGNRSVPIYVANSQEISIRLKTIVEENRLNIIDILTTHQLISGLDQKFNLFKESMLSDDNNLLDLNKCISKIMDRSERLQLENKQSQSSNQIAVLQVSSNVPPQLICNYCHRSGHIEANCYKKHPDKRPLSTGGSKDGSTKTMPGLTQPISKKNFKKIQQL